MSSGPTPPPYALVTGANGFIGRHLCQTLVDQGYIVKGLLLPGEEAHPDLPFAVIKHYGNLEDPNSLRGIIEESGIIFHLAARVLDYGRGKWFRNSILTGTENLWKATRDHAWRFVFASSVAAMGVNRHLFGKNETDPIQLTGIPYGDCKAKAEERLRELSRRDGIPISIFRPTNVIGPGSVWITEPVKRMKSLTGLPLIDGGEYDAALLSVHNLVDGIMLCGMHPEAIGETFFFRDEWDISWRQFMMDVGELVDLFPKGRIGYQAAWTLGVVSEAICRPFGRRPPVTRLGVGLTGRDLRVSNEKARTLLGWAPRQTYEECMEEIRTWWTGKGMHGP
ncbi:MAG: NAD-dependent epimerase/dehydratase family protein [Bacteroidota bacterium]